MTKIVVFKI